ncbi:MAG TPA: carboxypeptidase-like regulatory domain-containing protein [Parafilimonas sp.]|nr:carboxypeptidase-like regulatory domain-containing protein [Parafilimonas sp.]
MAEPSTHINYSFEDIQRYLLGKMSATEMHALEKAALQDPFLSDAIEGFREVSSSIAEQHLNEINASLQQEKQNSKVVLIKKSNQWLRIAAIFILLAGVAVTGYYFLRTSHQQNEIAQTKNEKTNKAGIANDSVAMPKPEAFSADKNQAPVTAENKKEHRISSPTKEKATTPILNADTIAENETNSVAALSAPSQAQTMDRSFAPIKSSKNDSVQMALNSALSGINLNEKTFAGKVVDENNKPVAGAVVETNDKKAAVSDLNGNFALQRNDSLLNVTATTVGYENKNAVLKPNAENLITLKENHSELSDVVVTGYGVKSNKSKKQTATPVGGWQNFNNYVTTKLNEDSTGTNNMSQDDIVELEFLIDNDGNPYNIHVTKSLDDKRNSKAIDILKSGPRWTTSSKNKKGKVAISF